MRKRPKKTEPDELDRRLLAKLEEYGGPLSDDEFERRLRAKLADLDARIAAKRAAEGS
jgi:hypothetical protein